MVQLPLTACVLLAVAAPQASDEKDKPAKEKFETRAKDALRAPAIFLMEWLIAPGLECPLAGIGRASIPALAKVLAKPAFTGGRTGAAAAFFVGSFKNDADKVVPILTRALADEDPAVCMHAVAALGRLGKAAAPAREALARAASPLPKVPPKASSPEQAAVAELSREMHYVTEVLASWALTQIDR